MNYFKARYFKAKTNDSWTQVVTLVLPPDTNEPKFNGVPSVKVRPKLKKKKTVIDDYLINKRAAAEVLVLSIKEYYSQKQI